MSRGARAHAMPSRPRRAPELRASGHALAHTEDAPVNPMANLNKSNKIMQLN